MTAIFRFIAAHNLLPIINTVICYRFFSILTHSVTDYFFAFGAAFCCWAIYFTDKINDNKGRHFSPTDRHYLSAHHRTNQWIIGSILMLLTLYHFHTFYITEIGLPLIIFIICISYLKVADTPTKIAKELVSSLIITTAICIVPIHLSGQYHQAILIPIFFGLIYCNMLTIGIIDQTYDSQYGFSSMPSKFGFRFTIILFAGIALAVVLLAIISHHLFTIGWACILLIIHSVLIAVRKKVNINLLHILSDACFTLPLAYL